MVAPIDCISRQSADFYYTFVTTEAIERRAVSLQRSRAHAGATACGAKQTLGGVLVVSVF
jgi:hypothetical protein